MLFILRILCHFAGVLQTGLFVATGVNYTCIEVQNIHVLTTRG